MQTINLLTESTDLEDLAYEFMTNAYMIFEEEISETEQKVSALNLIMTTLYSLTLFGVENFDTLCSTATSYCSKLLKKNLQCEALTLSAYLFYCSFRKQGNKVMEQLRKALKASEVCMAKSENFYLLVKILNAYLYFYQVGTEFMTANDVNDLLSFIKETVDEMEDQSAASVSLKALENTKEAIRFKAAEGDERMKAIHV